MNDKKITLQKIVNEIILVYNYSINEISKATEISEETIRRIKSGKTLDPHHSTAHKLISLYFKLQHQNKSTNKFSGY